MLPADRPRSHAAIEITVGEVLDAGLIPIVLGGDHSVRTVASRLQIVGADVVEVIPTAVGSADITALVADRIVREILTGIALRRRQGL